MKKAALFLPVFIVLFVFGIHGWQQSGYSFSNALYSTLQLIVLNGNFQDASPCPVELQLARFLLPSVTVLTLLALCWDFVKDNCLLIKLYFLPCETIVFDFSEPAPAAFTASGASSVLLLTESDVTNCSAPAIRLERLCRNRAKQLSTLKYLPLVKAKTIYITEKSTEQALYTAMKVAGQILVATSNHPLPNLAITVLESTYLYTNVYAGALAHYRARGGDVVWVHPHAQKARELERQCPPATEQSVSRPLHVGLVGSGPLAEEMLLHLIRQYAPLAKAPLSLSVFVQNSTEWDDFFKKKPFLHSMQEKNPLYSLLPLVRIRIIEWHPKAIAVFALLQAKKQLGCAVDHLYVFTETKQELGLACLRLQQACSYLSMPADITGCMHESDECHATQVSVHTVQEQPAQNFLRVVTEQNLMACIGFPQQSAQDVLAIGIHAAYMLCMEHTEYDQMAVLFATHFDGAYHKAKEEWKTRLDDAFRWSCRYAADNIPIKLNLLGFTLVPAQDAPYNEECYVAFEDALLAHREEMQEFEHRRYCTERLLAGWLPCLGKSNKALLLNTTLIPYNALSAQERRKDEAALRAIPYLLRHESVVRYYTLVRKENV